MPSLEGSPGVCNFTLRGSPGVCNFYIDGGHRVNKISH